MVLVFWRFVETVVDDFLSYIVLLARVTYSLTHSLTHSLIYTLTVLCSRVEQWVTMDQSDGDGFDSMLMDDNMEYNFDLQTGEWVR